MHTSTSIEPDHRAAACRTSPPTFADHLAAVADEGRRFAAVAAAGPLDVPVDACPGWTMRELVQHVGLVHLWAAANIAHPSERWLSVGDLSDLAPYWPEHTAGWPDDDGLVDWYRSTLQLLLHVIRTMPDDHRCLTFLPAPSPLVMWARRQACEIAIHRHDAEIARGRPTGFDRRFAADMLDELLLGFAPRMRAAAGSDERVMRVVATDVGRRLDVVLSASGVRVIPPAGDADLVVSGTAADLAVLLWNRPAGPSIDLDGDPGTLELWRETCRVEWR